MAGCAWSIMLAWQLDLNQVPLSEPKTSQVSRVKLPRTSHQYLDLFHVPANTFTWYGLHRSHAIYTEKQTEAILQLVLKRVMCACVCALNTLTVRDFEMHIHYMLYG
jgi:hypothetical protein